MDSIIAKVTDFNDMLVPELLAAGLNDQERIKSVRAPLEATVSTRAAVASDQVKEAVQGRQKELSRSIAPLVQAKMKPGYERGYAEAKKLTASGRQACPYVESCDPEAKDPAWSSVAWVQREPEKPSMHLLHFMPV